MQHMKILVVDDDEDFLYLIHSQLRANGFEVDTAPNGEQFHQKVQQYQPDVIMLDINMDGKDGRDFCKEIKSNNQTAKIGVILISADLDIRTIADTCGADAYLPKPIRVPVLKDKLSQVMHH